ncbi:MAG: methylglyoxal synthase [Gaiellales bacterium]
MTQKRPHRIALVAHDGAKTAMLALVERHEEVLRHSRLVATATTGGLLNEHFDLRVHCLKSGPMGGDLQIGALVAEEQLDLVVFLRDPLTAHPHDPDIQALMKVCDVHDTPLATNPATAELCLGALAEGAPARPGVGLGAA